MTGRRSRGQTKPDKRRRTGCLTCRSRRVKCDEEKPTCYRCRAGNFFCEGYEAPRRTAGNRTESPATGTSAFTAGNVARPLTFRQPDWRQEQLPFYHHYVTSTAVRLFWTGHVGFWRDQVAQISYGVDTVFDAILAIGAVHRAALLSSTSSIDNNFQEVVRCKVAGLSLYGEVLQSLNSNLLSNDEADAQVVLVVLLLCVYFECFMDNPTAAFGHLSAAIQVLQKSQSQLSDIDLSNIVPIYETILRLDTLANMLVPYTHTTRLYSSSLTSTEHPFWNRQLRQYWKRPPLPLPRQTVALEDRKKTLVSGPEAITIERGRLIELLTSRYNLCRLIWGSWQSERPSRDELLEICDELSTWKDTSHAIFGTCSGLDEGNGEDGDFSILPLPPKPLHFASPAAALSVTMFNEYLACGLSMLAATDTDISQDRDNQSFALTYQNLRICAGLMNTIGSSFKTCDAWNPGISIILFHAARRAFSASWQLWIITALHDIGREGLCNGHAFANTLEVMWMLDGEAGAKTSHAVESSSSRSSSRPATQSGLRRSRRLNTRAGREIGTITATESESKSRLGPIHGRLLPVLLPREKSDDGYQAFYLRSGSRENGGGRAVYLVARATWRQELVKEKEGKMQDLDLKVYDESVLVG